MRTFTFNGIRSDTYFLTNLIERSLLAPIETEIVRIPQRHGGYAADSYLNASRINITVSAQETNLKALRETIRQAAAWLFTKEDKQLIISDEPDKYYMARLSGETNLNELAETGETTLIFLLTDVFAYSTTEKSGTFADDGVLIVQNNGTAPTYPVFRVELQSDLTYFYMENVTTGERLDFKRDMLTGQVYIIDMATNDIKGETSGLSYLQHVEITSDFFPLQPGQNVLGVSGSAGAATWLYTTITFRERFY